MRQTLTFFIAVTFCFCGQKSKQIATAKDSVSTNSIDTSSTQKIEDKTKEPTTLEWEKHEDFLRNEILNHKDNKTLKESFLQEMYIRNVVRVLKDSVLVNIPFNLHGPDCGAPDCYSTDISFGFRFSDTLAFPKDIQFQEYEHGCVDKEKRLTGRFKLIEQTNRYIIYHSINYKRTLVLFSSNKENGTTAYYFTGIGRNNINGKNVYKIVEDYDEENKNSIYPFTSWTLTTNEYEDFQHK